jgi:citronellol/citronellal dehydrogenase
VPTPSEIFAPDALAGRVVLVTGGGTNLGLQAAIELHRAGASVVVAGRRAEVLEEAARRVGERCTVAPGDVREPESARAIVGRALADHGSLDVLVNNAGGQYFVPAQDIVAKGWAAVWRLNVEGTLTMTSAAAEAGFGDRGGTVVNVTVSPHRGYPGLAHTGAARAAIEQVTREQAEAWSGREISVIAAAIGRFDTESLRKYPENVWRAAASSVPLQRLGTLDEFAWLITLLASPLGRELSGSVVTLDGALDNWDGPWPRDVMLDDEGNVPTEERAGGS